MLFGFKVQLLEIFQKVIQNNGGKVIYITVLVITVSMKVETREQSLKSSIFLLVCDRLMLVTVLFRWCVDD